MIKILIVGEQTIIREGITSLFTLEGFEVVAQTISFIEALTLLNNGLEADIILADIDLCKESDLQLIKSVKEQSSSHKVVILSSIEEHSYITKCFQNGASAYLLKTVYTDELLFAIQHVNAGNQYICSELIFKTLFKLPLNSKIEYDPQPTEISKRELEVLNLIANGYSSIEISDLLFTSRRTVEGHRQSLIEKFGAKNTAELIRIAVKYGIID